MMMASLSTHPMQTHLDPYEGIVVAVLQYHVGDPIRNKSYASSVTK
jgi:hypothetical protein